MPRAVRVAEQAKGLLAPCDQLQQREAHRDWGCSERPHGTGQVHAVQLARV
jgi:hypothetical protein